MSSSSHVRPLFAVVSLLVAFSGPALLAQDPTPAPAPSAAPTTVVELGESLFKDVRLSTTGSMSCASCHKPERAFTEDKALAVGQSGVPLGRNTPTLLGLGAVAGFPVGGRMTASPKMVPLEERVLAPLHDLAEMDLSAEATVKRLSTDAASSQTFDTVFGTPEGGPQQSPTPPLGVTKDRIAAALAGYVRSLKSPETPTLLALAGSNVSLDARVGRGLDLFREGGRCQSCHSGPGLTDGNLHVVAPRLIQASIQLSEQAQAQLAAASASTTRRSGQTLTFGVRAGGSYGRNQSLERQTLPLVDVGRTAPYFRDGSAPTLAEAVRRHVADLRQVGAQRAEILANPFVLLAPRVPAKRNLDATTVLSPTAREQLATDAWIPAEMTNEQLDDLVSFLNSLSADA